MVGDGTRGATGSTSLDDGTFDDATEEWTWTTIDTGVNLLSMVQYTSVSGKKVVLFAGEINGTGYLKVYVDNDDDGRVDPTSEATIIGAADGLGPIAGIAVLGMDDPQQTTQLFVLDGTSSIVYSVDLNADEIPADLGGAFATPTNFPALSGALSLTVVSLDGDDAVAAQFRRDWEERAGDDQDADFVVFEDSDSNGTADWDSGRSRVRSFRPRRARWSCSAMSRASS